MRRERRAFFLSAVPQPPIELVDFAGVTPLGQTLRRTINFIFHWAFLIRRWCLHFRQLEYALQPHHQLQKILSR